MKLETVIILIKAIVVTFGGAAMSFVAAVSQWSNETIEPSKLQWMLIWATTVGGGMTALGGFLSSAFGRYLDGRNGVDKNGKTPDPIKP